MARDCMTTRRTLLGVAATVPAMLSVTRASATSPTVGDPHWAALVADYHAKRSVWLDACSYADDLMPECHEAWRALPPEPRQPLSGLPADFGNMTIAQIKAAGSTPAHEAAWADYERDHAAWAAEREAVRRAIVAPATARYRTTYAAYNAALNTLAAYRTSTLAHLGEKIEIVAAEYYGCDIPQEYLADVLADVRRMAAREGR